MVGWLAGHIPLSLLGPAASLPSSETYPSVHLLVHTHRRPRPSCASSGGRAATTGAFGFLGILIRIQGKTTTNTYLHIPLIAFPTYTHSEFDYDRGNYPSQELHFYTW